MCLGKCLGALKKKEEMNTEQDGNTEINMSGKQMKEGCMMKDKKADESTAAANNILRSTYRMYSSGGIKTMMLALCKDGQ